MLWLEIPLVVVLWYFLAYHAVRRIPQNWDIDPETRCVLWAFSPVVVVILLFMPFGVMAGWLIEKGSLWFRPPETRPEKEMDHEVSRNDSDSAGVQPHRQRL